MASPAPGRMIVLTGVCSDCVMPQVRPRFLFFFNDPATTEIYTLSLHDALPILVLASLPPRTPPERVALARAMKPHGAAVDATTQVERAVQAGDSGRPTPALLGQLWTRAGGFPAPQGAYRAAGQESALRPPPSHPPARR